MKIGSWEVYIGFPYFRLPEDWEELDEAFKRGRPSWNTVGVHLWHESTDEGRMLEISLSRKNGWTAYLRSKWPRHLSCYETWRRALVGSIVASLQPFARNRVDPPVEGWCQTVPRMLVDYVNQLAPTDSTAGKEASNLDYRLNFFWRNNPKSTSKGRQGVNQNRFPKPQNQTAKQAQFDSEN